jgi:hypothetical protein
MIAKIKLWLHRGLYAEPISKWDDYRHRNDPSRPAIACQLCGDPGHVEWLCPNAKRLGYFDEAQPHKNIDE